MRTRVRVATILTTVTVTLLALVAGTTTATAASAKPVPGPFAAQAAAAGLSAVQADGLQRAVDAVLAAEGGTQIDPNTVLWKTKAGTTRVVVPGEQQVRSFGPDGCQQGCPHGCNYLYLCLYQYPIWGGTQHNLFYCQDYYTPYSIGSWVNNQTPGTRATMKNTRGVPWLSTPGAYSEDGSFDGSFTLWVRPC